MAPPGCSSKDLTSRAKSLSASGAGTVQSPTLYDAERSSRSLFADHGDEAVGAGAVEPDVVQVDDRTVRGELAGRHRAHSHGRLGNLEQSLGVLVLEPGTQCVLSIRVLVVELDANGE